MKIIQAIFPKKIKTAKQFAAIIQQKHTQSKFLGMTFQDRFLLKQDVFETAAKTSATLAIPENIFLKYKGKGNPDMDLYVHPGAFFKAPKATFSDVNSHGKLVLHTAKEDLNTYGNAFSQTKHVEGTATAYGKSMQMNEVVTTAVCDEEAFQINAQVLKNATNKGSASQINDYVGGDAKNFSKKSQINEVVNGNAFANGTGSQKNVVVKGSAFSNGTAKQYNDVVDGNIFADGASEQTTGLVKGNAFANDTSKQNVEEVLGEAHSYNRAFQKYGSVAGALIKDSEAIQKQIKVPFV